MDSSTQVITPNDKDIVFFDGVCNLCNSSVNFIIDHDLKGKYVFAPLQSSMADTILGVEKTNDNIILRKETGEVLHKSSAVLSIARHLSGWPKLFLIGYILPRFLRDALYDLIAKNRYKWFGRRESCRMPEPGIESRFLQAYQNN